VIVHSRTPESVAAELAAARRIWLFLDYDGTLADFAPTPDHVCPEPELVALFSHLAEHPRIRTAIVSGRRLEHVRALVPVPGLFLAGTYGVELQNPAGERIDRVSHDLVRPTLDALKPRWKQLLAGRDGFFLEDKGWSLAVHARFAREGEAEEVLSAARQTAEDILRASALDRFRLLDGHRFLEVGPKLAHKGRTVDFMLDQYAWCGAVPVYLGDDDKDEEAFGVVKKNGGIAGLVSRSARETDAVFRLESPEAARYWLDGLLRRMGKERQDNYVPLE
jgi:trehalose 6-phosphate phosphatase